MRRLEVQSTAFVQFDLGDVDGARVKVLELENTVFVLVVVIIKCYLVDLVEFTSFPPVQLHLGPLLCNCFLSEDLRVEGQDFKAKVGVAQSFHVVLSEVPLVLLLFSQLGPVRAPTAITR